MTDTDKMYQAEFDKLLKKIAEQALIIKSLQRKLSDYETKEPKKSLWKRILRAKD